MSGDAHDRIIENLTFILIIWIFTWISNIIGGWTRLSPLVYYLLFGCVLGNLKWLHNTDFLTSFGEVAIMVVFFALGFEETVSNFMSGIKKAWGIASIGAAVPFVCGFGCSLLFWPDADMGSAVMAGLAVTATAVSLTMISLKSEGLATSKPAIGIMTSAVLDDVGSLALVAIMVPLATGEADPTVDGIAWIVSKAVIFFLVVIILHVLVLPSNVEEGCLMKLPLIRSIGIQQLLEHKEGEYAMLISLTFGLFVAMIAVWLGFHPAIGSYMGGLIMEEHYFELPDGANTYLHCLHSLEVTAYSWLGPIFFVNLGASIIIDAGVLGDVIGYSFILYAVLGIGQFVSASIAARYVPGGFTWPEAAMIGFGMLGRAELFFVVLNICYNEKGLFSKEQFYTFTFAALLLNITVPVSIAVYKPYYVNLKSSAALARLDRQDTIDTDRSSTLDKPDVDPAWPRKSQESAMVSERSSGIESISPPSVISSPTVISAK